MLKLKYLFFLSIFFNLCKESQDVGQDEVDFFFFLACAIAYPFSANHLEIILWLSSPLKGECENHISTFCESLEG